MSLPMEVVWSRRAPRTAGLEATSRISRSVSALFATWLTSSSVRSSSRAAANAARNSSLATISPTTRSSTWWRTTERATASGSGPASIRSSDFSATGSRASPAPCARRPKPRPIRATRLLLLSRTRLGLRSFGAVPSPLRRLAFVTLALAVCDFRLRIDVGARHELLPARPAEHDHDGAEREQDVPRRRDQLLRGGVRDGGLPGDVATDVERQRIRRLRDADGAGGERRHVRQRARPDNPGDRLERDGD